MMRPIALFLSLALLPLGVGQQASPAEAPADLSYTADGQMKAPVHYREWIYLTSGLDMSYSASAGGDMHMFDNVFVNPASYREFLKSGTWPDKTVFVLETRGAEEKVSINKRGRSQSADLMGLEVHVKDASLPGSWGFFEFGPGDASAKIVPQAASCYSCHESHGAVDHTFVQFYPTLIGIAKEKKTLSAAYLKEMAPAAATPAK